MDDSRELLIDLDNELGDGDLGITMTKAFSAAAQEALESTETNVSKLLIKIGSVIARTAPSTMGTLLATGFMRGGKSLADRDTVKLSELAIFFQHFVSGIMERGKAKPGEKTIIDILAPVAFSMSESAKAGRILSDAIHEALRVAADAVNTTSQLMAQHGRAAYYREGSVGKQDGGAYVGFLIIKGFADYLS